MKNTIVCVLLVLAAAAIGTLLRVVDLDERVMHTDEAVHAVKFAELLEEGTYTYDKHEYHGPTLNYFSLISTKIFDVESSPEVTDAMLRYVPVVCGVLIILLVLLVTDGLGAGGAVCSALMVAVSGAFVYYSRYYIQEMLLVCFTFGVMVCGWRYVANRKVGWAIATGIFAGLMYATKETCIIAFGSIGVAVLGVALMSWQEGNLDFKNRFNKNHIAAAVVSAAVISILFFSSFFSNPDGIFDSIRAYGTYFDRAGGGTRHINPWYFYLRALVFEKQGGGPVFSEAVFVVLSLVGFVSVLRCKASEKFNPAFVRFIAFYTVMMAAIYSAMPYKTPWCMLGFYHGMLLLAGFGVVVLWSMCKRNVTRVFVAAVLLCGFTFAGWQCCGANYIYSAHWRNPYVYGHTEGNFMDVVERIEAVAAVHPDGEDVYVEVICSEGDYWPLPWYLRQFTKIGWFDKADMNIPVGAIVIASNEDSIQQDVMSKIYELPPPGKRDMYVPLFDNVVVPLRPGVGLVGLVRKDVWDLYEISRKEFSEKKMDDKSEIEYEKFSHETMYTTLEILIAGEDKASAEQAARAAFDLADKLNGKLSRFIENSDVSRINAAKSGESVVVSSETFECLKAALNIHQLTGGLFDITAGSLKDLWAGGKTPSQSQLVNARSRIGMDKLLLDEANFTVTKKADGVMIDLGGIAKGYAVDKIAELLGQWGVERALIHGGSSSVRALKGPSPDRRWLVGVNGQDEHSKDITELELEDISLSSSSLIEGRHIIDPVSLKPVAHRYGGSVLTVDATTGDALATAIIIMSDEQLEKFRSEHPDIKIILQED